MRETERRRRELMRLVTERALGTQEELVAALEKRGFRASQASVSRDLSALRLTKVGGRWTRLPSPRTTGDPGRDRIRANVLGSATAGPHLLVLHTPPGEASAVALAIDGIGLDSIAGTVAGDDTIFVALAAGSKPSVVLRRLGVRPAQ